MFSINPNSGEPIYRQLTEQVKRMVAGGQLQPGAELPSVRELAAQYAINPMTISKAYSLLEADDDSYSQRAEPNRSQPPAATVAAIATTGTGRRSVATFQRNCNIHVIKPTRQDVR